MKIMAVDLGDARTGIAVCGRTELLASPVGVIEEKSLSDTVEKIACAAREYEAEIVVMGLPRNMDGTEGARAQKSRKAAELLGGLIPDIPIEMWDERMSTKAATVYLNATDTRGKKRKKVIDAQSAAIILESYLAFRKNTHS